jgi:hypothetical protein
MTDQPSIFGPIEGGAHIGDPDTALSAATNKRSMIRWGSQRQILLEAFGHADYSPNPGLTDEEAGIETGIARVADTRRCSELRAAGMIEPIGATRPTTLGARAMVCRITTRGRQALMQAFQERESHQGDD